MTISNSETRHPSPAADTLLLRNQVLAVAAWLLAWLLVFHDALLSAASVWLINDTFNHCFFVLPVVLYAIWQQRGAVQAQTPRYSALGGLLVLGALLTLALGQAAFIDVLQHLAVFGLLPAMVLFLLGWKVVRVIWFPLLFLLFSVPLGEELIPQFQQITADIAIALLHLIGVPVYRDGLYISVPNGHFVVAEACSGVRFFIACVVLGTAYAYLNFVSRWRALAFALFSVVMPIIANGIRAFGIIYIGHATNMKHAAGADHLVYGWFFFAVVVVLLLVTGHFFSDGHRPWQNRITTIDPGWRRHATRTTLLLAAAPLLLALTLKLVQDQYTETAFDLDHAGLNSVSKEQAQGQNWTPRLETADEFRLGQDAASGAQLFQAIYRHNEAGRELVSWANRVYDIDQWSLKEQTTQPVDGLGAVTVLDLTSLRNRQRLVAYWYVVPNRISSSQTRIKLQQAINTLLLQPSGGGLVAVSLDYRGNNETAHAQLQQVLNSNALRLSGLLQPGQPTSE
ncbi:MAG: exosortase A [Gammaproteobacteria bacterium]|nr:exosortase A [Gammaproteobacteria bacterium]